MASETPAQPVGDLATRVASARDAVYPALVNIETVIERFGEGRVLRSRSAGSGVVVTAEGHVLTNYHVAGRSIRITCTLPSGEILPARVVVHDPLTDLSVLRLDLSRRSAAAPPIPYATLGDSSGLSVGDVVLAMGNPLALASSMTQGIVSNPARVFADRGRAEIESFDLEDGEPTGLFTRWIQHDALILPGNSGGPLVDLSGRVVGINELGGGGIGFAIPATIARWVLEQALDDGQIVRGWLGFSVQPVRTLGLETGALVGSVQEGGPAARAGLAPGDVVIELGGEPAEVKFLEQIPMFSQRVAELRPGSEVELEIQRGDERRSVRIEVERMEPFLGEERELRTLGLTVQQITRPLALLQGLPVEGVLITGVRPGRAVDAARPRPMPGDVLQRLGDHMVVDLASFEKAIEENESNRLLVEVWRAGEQLATVIELKENVTRRWGGELPKAWLGLSTQVLTPDLASSLGAAATRGFRVTRVYPGTSAAASGIEVGDLITAVDDRKLEATAPQDAEELRRRLQERDPGETIELVVERKGKEVRLAAVLEEEPRGSVDAKEARREDLEVTVRAIALEDRLRERWSSEEAGVIVAEATTGGWAHLAGLRSGDLVIEVARQPVATPEAFVDEVAARIEAGDSTIPLLVRRRGRTLFVFIEPDPAEAP